MSGNFIKSDGSKKARTTGGGAGRVTVSFAVEVSPDVGREADVTTGPRNRDPSTPEDEPKKASKISMAIIDDGLHGTKGNAITFPREVPESGKKHDEATIAGFSTTTKPAAVTIKFHNTFIIALTNFTTTDGMGTRGGRCPIAGGEIKPVRADGFDPDGPPTDPDEVTKCGISHCDPECYVHSDSRNPPKKEAKQRQTRSQNETKRSCKISRRAWKTLTRPSQDTLKTL